MFNSFSLELGKLGANLDMLEWATHNQVISLEQFWQESPRYEWMTWILRMLQPGYADGFEDTLKRTQTEIHSAYCDVLKGCFTQEKRTRAREVLKELEESERKQYEKETETYNDDVQKIHNIIACLGHLIFCYPLVGIRTLTKATKGDVHISEFLRKKMEVNPFRDFPIK